MSDLEYWTAALRKAEQELDAATLLSDVNAAARRYMLAKAELKRLEQRTGRPVSPLLSQGGGNASVSTKEVAAQV